MRNKGIKKQALLLILACCLLTLLLSGGIAIYGMTDIKSSAEKTGRDIGQSAAENSSKALQQDAQRDLSRLLEERGELIDMIFDNLGANVGMIADEMSEIQEHPGRYSPRQVQEPQRSNAGTLAPQLQFAPGVMRDDPALQQEIGLAANIQDWLLRLDARQEMVASVYIASRNGFGITVDDRSEQKFRAGEEAPFAIDFRTRPWYQEAEQEKRMIYSSIFMDVYSGNYGITCAAPYFTASGETAGVVGAGMFLNRIKDIVRKTSIGETGFGFIIDKDGRVLFSPKLEGSLAAVDISGGASLFEASDESLAAVAHDMVAGNTGLQEVMVDGVPCYLAYRPLKAMECSFGIVMEVAEVTMSARANEQVIADSTNAFLDTLNHSIRSSLLAVLVLVLLLLLLVPFLSNKVATRFVQPIHELSDGVREIASGNLDTKLDIRTGNEIEHLAVCFNAMTDELQSYMRNLTKVTAERERIATELDVATRIQESMLPNIFPPFPERQDFDIYATMHAAKHVGGDFYDFYLLDEKHLLFTIADVSGKGVPAALFMVIAKTILKNFALTMGGSDDLAPLVSCTNDQLCQNNDAMMFVTAFVGMLELDTGRLSYVNAGHNPPLVYRAAEQRFSFLDVKRNFVLGGMDELEFHGQEIILAPQDRIFLYTDGVTEALNEEKELYGEERLLSCLNGAGAEALSLEELLAVVRSSLTEHVKDAEQSDDITMLALVYRGQAGKEA